MAPCLASIPSRLMACVAALTLGLATTGPVAGARRRVPTAGPQRCRPLRTRSRRGIRGVHTGPFNPCGRRCRRPWRRSDRVRGQAMRWMRSSLSACGKGLASSKGSDSEGVNTQGHLRFNGSAAHARGRRSLRQRPFRTSVGKPGRSFAGVPALRRKVGTSLARFGALC